MIPMNLPKDLYNALMQMATIVSEEQSSVLEIIATDSGVIVHLVPCDMYNPDYDDEEDDFDGNYE